MTQAELTIEQIKEEMEKCKTLFVEVGTLMHGQSVGVGTLTLSKSLATVAYLGDVPIETLLDLVADAYQAIKDGLEEDGALQLH